MIYNNKKFWYNDKNGMISAISYKNDSQTLSYVKQYGGSVMPEANVPFTVPNGEEFVGVVKRTTKRALNFRVYYIPDGGGEPQLLLAVPDRAMAINLVKAAVFSANGFFITEVVDPELLPEHKIVEEKRDLGNFS